MPTHRRTLTAAAVAAAGLAIGAGSASAVIPVQTGPIGWTSQDGTSVDDYVYRLAPAPSGGVYLGGGTSGGFPGQTPSEDLDCVVARYDKLGNALWHRQIPSNDECDPLDLASTANGDVAAAIMFYGTTDGNVAAGNTDAMVAKFDKNGNRKWTHVLSSSGDDAFEGVAMSSSGNVYVVGYIAGNVDGLTPVGRDVVVAKYDKKGNRKWIKNFGTSEEDAATAIAIGPNEDLYITGHSHGDFSGNGNLGQEDVFVLKLDKNGVEKGRARLGTSAGDRASAIAVTKQDGVRVVGFTTGQLGATPHAGSSDPFVAAFGLDLSSTWVTQFGAASEESLADVALVKGVTYAVGSTYGALFGTNQGGTDGFVVKLDASGAMVWGRQFGTGGSDDMPGIVVRSSNANGGGVVIGMTADGAAFGHASAGGTDFLLAAIPR